MLGLAVGLPCPETLVFRAMFVCTFTITAALNASSPVSAKNVTHEFYHTKKFVTVQVYRNDFSYPHLNSLVFHPSNNCTKNCNFPNNYYNFITQYTSPEHVQVDDMIKTIKLKSRNGSGQDTFADVRITDGQE